MKHYNVIQESCNSDHRIVLNHEPVGSSVSWDMLEVLRRSYQDISMTIVHCPEGFIVADASQWIVKIYRVLTE